MPAALPAVPAALPPDLLAAATRVAAAYRRTTDLELAFSTASL